jgi:hypothetical protein
MANQGHHGFNVPQAVSTALLSGARAPCALRGPIPRRHGLATSLVPANPAKRKLPPPLPFPPLVDGFDLGEREGLEPAIRDNQVQWAKAQPRHRRR